MLLEFQSLIQRFFGSQIQRKRNWGPGCLSINEVKDYFKDLWVLTQSQIWGRGSKLKKSSNQRLSRRFAFFLYKYK